MDEGLRDCACQAAGREAALCDHLAAYIASQQGTLPEAALEPRSRVPAAERLSAPLLNLEIHEHDLLACLPEHDAAVNPSAAAGAAAIDCPVDGQVAPSVTSEHPQPAAIALGPSPDFPPRGLAVRAAGVGKAAEAELIAVDTMSVSDKVS